MDLYEVLGAIAAIVGAYYTWKAFVAKEQKKPQAPSQEDVPEEENNPPQVPS